MIASHSPPLVARHHLTMKRSNFPSSKTEPGERWTIGVENAGISHHIFDDKSESKCESLKFATLFFLEENPFFCKEGNKSLRRRRRTSSGWPTRTLLWIFNQSWVAGGVMCVGSQRAEIRTVFGWSFPFFSGPLFVRITHFVEQTVTHAFALGGNGSVRFSRSMLSYVMVCLWKGRLLGNWTLI